MDESGFHHQPAEDHPAANGAVGAPPSEAIPQSNQPEYLHAQAGGFAAGAPVPHPTQLVAAGNTASGAPAGVLEDAVDDEKTDSDADMPAPLPPPIVEQAPAPAAARPPPAFKPAARRGGGRGGIITLAHLIDDGIIEPGEDILSVEYKGSTHIATLLPDGRISCNVAGQDLTFESPSAFSIYLKRLVNPTRKADDGWKTVKYRGRLLEQYKAELARKRLGLGEGGDSTAALEAMAALEPRAAKRARTDGSETRFKFGGGIPSIATVATADRPRRQRRAPPRFAAIGVDDEHALQPLEAYLPGEQPFSMYVHPAAEVMMDFHAHLCMNEIIGILAGTWDPLAKRIDILRAYPVRELTTENDSINVEMDPEDQVAKMDEVQKAGLKVVGWYHSHPTFQAIPSTIDIYNQVLQQHAHREEGGDTGVAALEGAGREGEAAAVAAAAAAAVTSPGHVEPYVAAIVSPYDRNASSPLSTINWFYVSHAPGAVPAEGQRPDEVGCIGKALAFTSLYEPLGQLENLQILQREMEQLAKRYAEMPDRANLEAAWVDGQLRAEKLVNSLVGRLRPVSAIDEGKLSKFADKVLFSTRAVWNIYGKPLLVGAGVGQGLASAAAAATAAGTLPSSSVGAANPSGPASTAISQEGGDTETAVGSEQQPEHEDEPISDADDDEATDDE